MSNGTNGMAQQFKVLATKACRPKFNPRNSCKDEREPKIYTTLFYGLDTHTPYIHITTVITKLVKESMSKSF